MKKIGGFLKKHKKLCIVLTILVVLGVLIGRFVHKTSVAVNEILSAMAVVDTAVVERRNLVESISASGKLISPDSESISVAVTNVEVMNVGVEVGDKVSAGDLLCVLDSSDLEKNLENLRTSVENTQKLNDINLSSAQRNLNNTKTTENIQLSRLDKEIEKAKEDLDGAQRELDDAWDAFYDSGDKLNEIAGQIEQLQAAGAAAAQVAALEKQYQELETLHYANIATVNAKDAVVVNYRSAYDKLVEQREDSQRTYDSQVAAGQDSVNTTRISSSTAGASEELQIEKYEEQIADCKVTAPIGGIVTQLNVKEGDIYNGTLLAVVENTDSFEVSAEIDEYDIGKIKAGQRVIIKTNGTGDVELEGTVKKIAPKATASAGGTLSGAVTYNVVIAVDTPCDDLRLDMTAKLSIIIESRENVLTVPYTSVQEDEEGKFYVELFDAQTQAAIAAAGKKKEDAAPVPEYEKIYVTKGIESDYYIEVISDEITEGMEVVVPAQEGTSLEDLLMLEGPMGGF